MRVVLFLLFVFTGFFSLLAQQQQQSNLNLQGKTYAIIVGISKYENGIPQLDFAHNDAKVFADFLRSKAGGSVPEDHIRLLINEQATFSEIYDAFNWLLETCQKNDLVYFYFSGHGDLEKKTIFQLGYLLASNTPGSNYINNAVRIEDLNNFANTLSAGKKAKVILITDACHSGKLAGSDFKGNKLVAEQLKAIKEGEIRIASCEPDQLSNEDEGWGGGRGVFSYYLIKGMEGLADQQEDGIITVSEIKTYLNNSLANDQLLAQKVNKQTPVIEGTDNVRLATVDTALVRKQRQQQSSMDMVAPKTLLKPLGVQPQAYLFDLIKRDEIERLVDFDRLGKLSKEEMPFAFIQMIRDSVLMRNYDDDPDLVRQIDDDKIDQLKKTLKENSDALKRFNEKLVVMLSDHGQSVINLYLDGDAAELERRRYYNAYKSGYDIYPKMFAVALKLISPQHPLYKILEVKLHYFSGVAARLKIPTVEDPKPFLELAMAEQKKALALEKNAAYIYAELGILYDYKDDYVNAQKNYLKAAEIAPQWVIPWSNMIGVYGHTKKYDKALEASKKAIELKKDFQGIYINTGFVYQKKGNLLFAEELFQKSIAMNSRHFLPYENLGIVYLNTTQYELADYYFYQADIRKRGFHNPRLMRLPKPDSDADGVVDQFDQCQVVNDTTNKNTVLWHFLLAIESYRAGEHLVAESEFNIVIQSDPNNPLAYHYLGKILYEQKRWKQADIIFNYAVNNYLPDSAFNSYGDSLARQIPNPDARECILSYFKQAYYGRVEDHYFLASLYETWNHFTEAERHYRTLIKLSPEFVGSYYRLWTMQEKLGRYKDAEETIRSYMFWDKEITTRELYQFNKRMIRRFPGDADLYYKAGLLLYHYAANVPGKFSFDRKKIEPDTHEEVFVSLIPPMKSFDTLQREFILPGTGDTVIIADRIFRPYTEGIQYLKKVDSLLQDADIQADVNYKIGDMYTWQGLPERSVDHYKRSIDLKPADANTRSKLIAAYSFAYQLGNALDQLDSLHQRKEINLQDQMLMAEYCIHAGRFDDAGGLLKEAKNIYPFNMDKITDLNGRLQLLSNHPKEALIYYKEYLAVNPNDHLTMYTIARLYAQMKNKREALKWLKVATDTGFYYYWVVIMDTVWKEYRNVPQWKALVKILEPNKEMWESSVPHSARVIDWQ